MAKRSLTTAYLPREVTWSNWGRIFTDLSLWRPVVERICRERGISRASLVENTFPGTCAVFLVDRQVVLKIFPPFLPQDYDKEKEVYQRLGGRIREMPRLLADGVFQDQINWPYLALDYRRGSPIRELRPAIDSHQMSRLAVNLGRLIRQVHEVSLSEFTQFDARPKAWRLFINQRREECVEELRQATSLPEEILGEIEEFLDTTNLTPPHFEPVLINADLTEDHLLLVPCGEGWQISALIDWADAEAGAPEYEWVALWFGLCNRDPEMFRHSLLAYDPALQLDQKFLRRTMAYTLLHRFGAGIISHALINEVQMQLNSLAELQDLLWPPTLCSN